MSRARIILVVLLTAVLVFPAVAGCGASPARQALEEARRLDEQAELTRAVEEYERARSLFLEEGEEDEAAECRAAAQSAMLVQASYPDLEADVRKKLAEKYPGVPEKEREGWVSGGELEHMTWDGKVHYFDQAADNIATRHVEIARRNAERSEQVAGLVKSIRDSSAAGTVVPWQPYSNPMTWAGTHSVKVPRGELPESGLLKLWFPLPVSMGSQDSVSVNSVTPDKWLKQPPSIEGPLSDAYFEVPLEELDGDLEISVEFQFTHYQENYVVDPANVGEYDRQSAVYRRYTRSHGNTYISDEIRETAKRVAGGEKNPYLAAKKLYEYILKEIKYSYMPHMAAWPRGERESEYVHRLRRGDCGAQAMYFSALCRSLGIPARTTGGWQLFTGEFAGHFWAEFFLPNYGWIPVDPTAAEISDWTDRITEDERREFKAYYFGNLDPLRCNVQLDVDEELIPPADGEILIPLALQFPTGTCKEMEEPPGVMLSRYSTLTARLVSGDPGALVKGPLH